MTEFTIRTRKTKKVWEKSYTFKSWIDDEGKWSRWANYRVEVYDHAAKKVFNFKIKFPRYMEKTPWLAHTMLREFLSRFVKI